MRRQGGFTLVEVLIATAVIVLALGAFISGGARYADYARYIHDKTIAQWVARNQLVEYQTAPQWPDTGKQDGDEAMGGRDWHWVADVQESPDPNVRRIDVQVFRIDDNSGRPQADPVTTLSGFVTQHLEAQNAPPGAANNTSGNNANDSGPGGRSGDGS